MKIKTYKKAYVTWDVLTPSGMIEVKVRCDNGYLDKVRCDSRDAAREYWKSFCAIAKTVSSSRTLKATP
jgi:hypothetical protein